MAPRQLPQQLRVLSVDFLAPRIRRRSSLTLDNSNGPQQLDTLAGVYALLGSPSLRGGEGGQQHGSRHSPVATLCRSTVGRQRIS